MSWQALTSICRGSVISSFSPSSQGGSDVGSTAGDQADNPFLQQLTVGDEVYAFEEFIKVDGERWYRGYVVIRQSIQDVSLNVFNMPITSLACYNFPLGPPSFPPHASGHAQRRNVPISTSSEPSLLEQRQKFSPPNTGPVVYLGMFPAVCVHIRGEVEACKETIESAMNESGDSGDIDAGKRDKDSQEARDETGTMRHGGESSGAASAGAKAPLSGLGFVAHNGNINGSLPFEVESYSNGAPSANAIERAETRPSANDADQGEKQLRRRTASRVTLSKETIDAWNYMQGLDYTPQASNGDKLEREPSSSGQPSAPLPALRSDRSSTAGLLEPIIDHIAEAIRLWTPRLPVLLRTSAYKTFEHVSRLLKLLISARTRLLAGDMTRAERRDLRGDCVGWLRDGDAALAMDVKLIDEESGSLLVTGLEKAEDTATTKWMPPMRLIRLEQQEMESRVRKASLGELGLKANGNPPNTATGSISTPISNGTTASPLGKKFSIAKKLKEAEPSLRVEFQALTASLCQSTESLELYFSIYDRGLKAFISEEWHLLVSHLGMVQVGNDPEDVSGQRAKRTMFETIGAEKSTSFLVIKVVKVAQGSHGAKLRNVVAMGVCGLAALPLHSKGSSEKVVELYGVGPEVRLVDLHERLAARTPLGVPPLQGSLVLNLRLERQSAHRRLRSISLTRSFHVDDGRDELYIKLGAVHLAESVDPDDMAATSTESSTVHCHLSLQAADGTQVPESIQLGGNSGAQETAFDSISVVDRKTGYLGYLLKFRNLEPSAILACRIGRLGHKPVVSLLRLVEDGSYLAEGVHRLHLGGSPQCWLEARVHLCSSSRIQNKVLAGLLRYEQILPAERQELMKLVNFVDPDVMHRHRRVCLNALLRIVDAESVPDPEKRAAFGCAMILLNQFEDLPEALAKERIPAGPIFQVLGSAFQADKRMDAIRALPHVLALHLKQGISAPDGHFPSLFRDLMRKLTGVIRDGGEQTLAFRVTALVAFPAKIVAEAFPPAEAVECLSAFIEAFNSRDCPPLIQEARLSLLERMLLEVPTIALQLLPVIIRAVRPVLQQLGAGSALHAARRKAFDLIGVAIDAAITDGNQAVTEYLAQAGLLILLPLRDSSEILFKETIIDALVSVLFFICTKAQGDEQSVPLSQLLQWGIAVRREAFIGLPACNALVSAALVKLCQLAQRQMEQGPPEMRSIAVELLRSPPFARKVFQAAQLAEHETSTILLNALQFAGDHAAKRVYLDVIFTLQPSRLGIALAAASPQGTWIAGDLNLQACHNETLHQYEALEDDWTAEIISGIMRIPRDQAHVALAGAGRAARCFAGTPWDKLNLLIGKLQDLLQFDLLTPSAAWHGILRFARTGKMSRTLRLCLHLVRSQLSGFPTSDLLCAAASFDMKHLSDRSASVQRALQLKDYKVAADICGEDAHRALSAGEHFLAAQQLRQQSDILFKSIIDEVSPLRFWRTTLKDLNASVQATRKRDLDLIWALRDADSLGNLMSDLMRAFPSAEIRQGEEPLDPSRFPEMTLYLEEVELAEAHPGSDGGMSFQARIVDPAPGTRRSTYSTASALPGLLPHSPINAISIEILDRDTIDAESFDAARLTLSKAVWRMKVAMDASELTLNRRKALSDFSRALDILVDDEDLVAMMTPYITEGGAHGRGRQASQNLLNALESALVMHGDCTTQTDLRGFHITLMQLYNSNFNQALNLHGVSLLKPASSPSYISSPSPSSPQLPSYRDSPTDRSQSPSPSMSRPRSSLSHTLSEKMPELKRRWGSLRYKPPRD